MGSGITLVVVGAILAFGIRAEPRYLDLDVVGLVLIVAGAALIAHARRGTVRERVTTHSHPGTGASVDETDRTTVVDRTIE